MRLRAGCRALVVTGATVLGVLAGPALPAGAATEPGCRPWTVRVVAAGLGSLENLHPDGTGGMLVSASTANAVERVSPDGSVTTVAAGLPSPGGLRVVGRTLYVATGDAAQSGAAGTADGTVRTVDLDTGVVRTLVSGLVMPNGLARAADGTLFTSRDVSTPATATGITRISPTGTVLPRWASVDDSNGMALDEARGVLYVDETFTPASNVYRVPLADPAARTVVASLSGVGSPAPKGLDDLTLGPDGVLVLAANGSGEVIRLDPDTGATCVVASGLMNTSAVKYGAGPGWPATDLYVTGFDGRLLELTPPTAPAPALPESPLPALGLAAALGLAVRRVARRRRA